MEGRFGHQFGDVRIHADETAAASAFGLDAAAYSTDRHIVFGAGQYAPRSPRGERLLAHELAHVAQRDSITPDARRSISGESALETDARRAATAAIGEGDADVHEHAGPSTVLREAATTEPRPPSRPQREERFSLGRGAGRVDAELDRSANLLTAKMKVKFVRRDAPTPWPSAARFTQFQSDFIRAVVTRWSYKHYLVPARQCQGEPSIVAVACRSSR